MNTKITKCLFLGALAIGMTSTAMAGEHSKTENLCDLSTMKGLYHFSSEQLTRATAGELRFDGQGGGVANVTVKYPIEANLPDIVIIGANFRYEQDSRGECVFSILNAPLYLSLTIYAEASGDAASMIAQGEVGVPQATEITRGPLANTHD